MNSLSRRKLLALSCAALVPPVRRTQDVQPTIQGVSRAEGTAIAKLGKDFRRKFNLPGVSLAMSFRGKLKLTACFGYADKERAIPVQTKHQFRIASVSKPITAVAVLKLAEQKKLSLDDTIFGQGGHLRQLFTTKLKDPTQRALAESITIRHLLEHSGGGWTNQRGEVPMFAPPALGMSHPRLITWTLENIALRTKPGTTYAYSNFGYCLLGRVIEKVTGQPYEQAVTALVLKPVKANATHIGKHTRAGRRVNEVVYYDKYDPYGKNMDVSRMDSHGGWISTAIDLVRFAQSVDGFPTPPDILNRNSINAMTTPSRGSYAFGWNTNASNNWWHTGSFNGGSSILARIHDGHCWAVLVNTRSYDKSYFAALDQFPWTVKQAVQTWGNQDLFQL